MNPMAVPITDQVFRVVRVSKPQNLPMSQKPESLTWEKVMEPAAMATTIAASAMPLRPAPRQRAP